MNGLERLPTTLRLPVLAGVLLAASTMTSGVVLDDVLVRARFSGQPTAWGPSPWWDLYTFARPELNEALRGAGLHPWWSDPAVKMTFFRPLSALTHGFDHGLWPHAPFLHHLHSLLWYGLAIAVAGLTFRRLQPDPPHHAARAALFFALASPHVMTVAWVAARNTLIAFVFACVGVVLHAEGRRGASVVVFAIGLLAGEAVLGGLAYVLAWTLFMESGPLLKRLGDLVPHGLVLMVWRVLHAAGGFGSNASGIYHDPVSEPLAFLEAILTNLPVLLLSEWTLIPLDGWAILPRGAHAGLFVAGVALIPLLGLLLAPLLRESAHARFWSLGMVLALAPFTATMPMDRLLIFSGLGASALLSALTRTKPSSRSAQAAITFVVVLHLPVSIVWGAVRGLTIAPGVAMFRTGLDQAPADEAVPDQTFVYVTGTFHRVHYTTFMRQTTDRPIPRRSLTLSSFLTDTIVRRLDERSLEVTAEGGFMAYDLDLIHRRDAHALPVGAVTSLPDAELEVTALTPDGRPATVIARFRVQLEDPSLRWLVVDAGEDPPFPPSPVTRPFPLPARGETVRIPGVLPF